MNKTSDWWRRLRDALALAALLGCMSGVRAQEAVPVIQPLDLGAELEFALGTPVDSQAVAVNDLGQVAVNAGPTVVILGQVAVTHAYFWSAQSGFVDLGTLGGDSCRAMAINNAGEVVGNSTTAEGVTHGFRWTLEGGIEDMGTVTYPSSSAEFINDLGQIAGFVYDPGAFMAGHAVWWGDELEPTDIHDDALGQSSYVSGLNNLGQAVGIVQFGVGGASSFIWGEGTGMQALESPEGSSDIWATALNDQGEVVGSIGGCACFWTPDRSPMILEQTESLFSEAVDVNNTGQIVGYSDNELGYSRATLWMPAAGDMVQLDMGSLDENFPNSYAVAINELGQIVGYCTVGGGGIIIKDAPTRTVAWTESAGMIELGDVGDQHSDVATVNNFGLAVGVSRTASGEYHACVWQLPLSPEEGVEAIGDEVADLVDDGSLNDGEATALLATLQAAADKLAEGKTRAATSMIAAFIKQVEAKVKSGKLTPEEGAALIAAARAMLEG